jgi:L-threonylcarbamoyladenylate synthase
LSRVHAGEYGALLFIRANPFESRASRHGGYEVADNTYAPIVLDTIIWRVDPQRPEPEFLRLAGELLNQGGVILFPTETFYGIGANPRLPLAVERIYRIKGREFNKPLPLIAANLEAVYGAVREWSMTAERLAQSFWPGPLTLVLPAAADILPQVHGGTGKIGIRISSHPVAQALATGGGGLVTSTSANQAHQQAFRAPSEIPAGFLALVDGLIDAGPSGGDRGSLPSTVVDAGVFPPELIRAGCIPWERLMQAIS